MRRIHRAHAQPRTRARPHCFWGLQPAPERRPRSAKADHQAFVRQADAYPIIRTAVLVNAVRRHLAMTFATKERPLLSRADVCASASEWRELVGSQLRGQRCNQWLYCPQHGTAPGYRVCSKAALRRPSAIKSRKIRNSSHKGWADRDWITVENVRWRALPKEYGNWNTVWKRFERLSKAGVFEAFFDALASMSPSAHLIQMFDSTIVRAHVSAAGAKGGKTARPSVARVADSRRKSTQKQIEAKHPMG
eukprot:gene6456-6523_t